MRQNLLADERGGRMQGRAHIPGSQGQAAEAEGRAEELSKAATFSDQLSIPTLKFYAKSSSKNKCDIKTFSDRFSAESPLSVSQHVLSKLSKMIFELKEN